MGGKKLRGLAARRAWLLTGGLIVESASGGKQCAALFLFLLAAGMGGGDALSSPSAVPIPAQVALGREASSALGKVVLGLLGQKMLKRDSTQHLSHNLGLGNMPLSPSAC